MTPPTPLTTTTSKPASRIRLGLTSGCPAGVGPELWPLALAVLARDGWSDENVALHFYGSPALFAEGCRRANIALVHSAHSVRLLGFEVACHVNTDDDHNNEGNEGNDGDDGDDGARTLPGKADDNAIVAQRRSLLDAIAAAKAGEVDAIVTAPVRKRALDVDGVQWPGQTELVHHHLAVDDDEPLMVFAGGPFILGLCTVHLPLRAVADAVTVKSVQHALRRLAGATAALRADASEATTLVVLGLNPHAGEGGRLGDEEQTTISPAVAAFQAAHPELVLRGPLPADGFFADVARCQRLGLATPADGVLAMTHDQGLAPYKLLCGGAGVNITWGLCVPRTSPDHGTADAIAGTGRADPASTVAALRFARQLGGR